MYCENIYKNNNRIIELYLYGQNHKDLLITLLFFLLGEDRGNFKRFIQKRFYTRITLKSIRISWLAKIPTCYRYWLRFFENRIDRDA